MDLEILKIASDTKNHRVLKNCSHFAKFKNPLCGDEMNVSLMVKGEKITDPKKLAKLAEMRAKAAEVRRAKAEAKQDIKLAATLEEKKRS